MFSEVIIQIVKVYQKVLSPDHSFWAKSLEKPPYCKHTPTCSEYMIEAVEKKGPIVGVAKGTARIFRCMPWNKGGYDPVDPVEKNID
ncbi:membrane protein insertion efficiency factor YidD [Candidatus Gracilibacteria bacterium]|nr:membrane protein insertion efficiency factor YidD [Candidatus Gracilibacteria bacterium]